MKVLNRKELLVLTSGLLSAIGSSMHDALAQKPSAVPTIKVTTELFDVHDDPLKDDGLYASIRFRWNAGNCDYVLIEGLSDDEKHYDPKGVLERTGGGDLTFIAVGRYGMTRQVVHARSTFRRGTGVHGLIWSVNNSVDVNSLFSAAFQAEVSTTLTLDRSGILITTKVFQPMQLTVAGATLPNHEPGLLLYTPNYISLSDDGMLVRLIAFNLWMKREEMQRSLYLVKIAPIVMVRAKAAGGAWKRDRDEAQLGIQQCKTLAQNIQNALR